MTKAFGFGGPGSGVVRHLATGPNVTAGMERQQPEVARVARMMQAACPPSEMAAAAVAPARGTMQLVANFELLPGGRQRRDGSHWRSASVLEVMMVQAQRRAEGRDLPTVALFTPEQIDVAREYRGLVEWRAGSGIKCASIEAGRGGGGGDFLDRFIDKGAQLARIEGGIGSGLALNIRRNMDRGNGRRPIPDRALVDMVVLQDRDLTAALVRYGWKPDGKTRADLRAALCRALDRMQMARDS